MDSKDSKHSHSCLSYIEDCYFEKNSKRNVDLHQISLYFALRISLAASADPFLKCFHLCPSVRMIFVSK